MSLGIVEELHVHGVFPHCPTDSCPLACLAHRAHQRRAIGVTGVSTRRLRTGRASGRITSRPAASAARRRLQRPAHPGGRRRSRAARSRRRGEAKSRARPRPRAGHRPGLAEGPPPPRHRPRRGARRPSRAGRSGAAGGAPAGCRRPDPRRRPRRAAAHRSLPTSRSGRHPTGPGGPVPAGGDGSSSPATTAGGLGP